MPQKIFRGKKEHQSASILQAVQAIKILSNTPHWQFCDVIEFLFWKKLYNGHIAEGIDNWILHYPGAQPSERNSCKNSTASKVKFHSELIWAGLLAGMCNFLLAKSYNPSLFLCYSAHKLLVSFCQSWRLSIFEFASLLPALDSIYQSYQ